MKSAFLCISVVSLLLFTKRAYTSGGQANASRSSSINFDFLNDDLRGALLKSSRILIS